MKDWKIYIIYNKVNEKRYVGVTCNGVLKRFKEHSKSKYPLGVDIRKYGQDNFLIETVGSAIDRKEADRLERSWINALKTKESENGYNAVKIFTNNPLPQETPQNMLKELDSLLTLYNDGDF